MRSPDGVDYWLGGIYREIVEPERLVFTHAWEDEQDRTGPGTLVTVTFAEHGDKTKLTFRQAGFESTAARDSRDRAPGPPRRVTGDGLRQAERHEGD